LHSRVSFKLSREPIHGVLRPGLRGQVRAAAGQDLLLRTPDLMKELIDARKHIHNSPAVSVTESELPRTLIESFPEEKASKYSFENGIVSISTSSSTQRSSGP
jgi:hypothetical protein